MGGLSEHEVNIATVANFRKLGYEYVQGPAMVDDAGGACPRLGHSNSRPPPNSD